MASYYGSWVQAGSNSVGKMRMRIDTSYSQNASKNQSTVTIKQYLEPSQIKYTGDEDGNTIALIDSVKLIGNGSSQTKKGNFYFGGYYYNKAVYIQSKTWTVNHKTDGTGSFSFSGTCSGEFHTFVSFPNQGWETKTISIGTKYITLPKINRVSTIKTASSVEFGKSLTFNITRNGSTSTVHTLTYEINGTKGEIGTKIGTSKTWTVPLSLISKVPNAPSAKMTVTCTTYDGSTKIGTSTCSITCTVPSSYKPSCSFRKKEIYEQGYKPTENTTYQADKEYFIYNSSTNLYELFTNYEVGDSISGNVYEKNYFSTADIAYQNEKSYYEKIDEEYKLLLKRINYNVGEPIASLFPINANGWNLFIQNITQLQGSIYAEGIEGSTIKSYIITLNDNDIYTTNPFLTSTLTKAGLNTIKVKVKDSRGAESPEVEEQFYITGYSLPSLGECKIERCTSEGTLNEEGEYGKITLSYSALPVDNLNFFKLKVYKKDDDTIYKEINNSSYNQVSEQQYKRNKNYYKYKNNKYNLLIAGKDYEIGDTISGTVYQKDIIIDWEGSYSFDSYFSNLKQDSSYTFVFRIEDEFNSFQSEKSVSPIFVTMSLKNGGHGVSFGRTAKEDNVLANYMDTKLYAKTWVNDMSIGGFKTMKIRDGSWVIYEED